MNDVFNKDSSGKSVLINKATSISKALESILSDVKKDESFREKLMHKSGISKKKFHEELMERAGFGVPMKFYSNPDYYLLVQKIRFLVEGVQYSLDEVKNRYADLIMELMGQPHKTTDKLSNRNRDLYKRIMKTGHSKMIWFLSGFGKKQHRFYLTDQELVKQCGEFSSFTELKNKGAGDLHEHIKGRKLEEKVVREHPKYLSFFYIGINNKYYRSLGELAIGNMCEFNEEEYLFQASYKINRKGSDKSMISDFLFYDHLQQPVYLEIVQNTEETRGERREIYAVRHQKKIDMLNRHGISPICLTTDDYYNHGLFNFKLFAYDVSRHLSKRGVDLKEVPQENILSMQYSDYADFLINSDEETIFKHLVEEGVTGIAVLDNCFSTVKNILKARPDNFLKKLRNKLMTKANSSRSEKNSERHKQNREKMMPLDELKKLVQQKQIKSQSLWFKFARENKEFLRENRIPCDVANVYKHRGEWVSWPDFYRQA